MEHVNQMADAPWGAFFSSLIQFFQFFRVHVGRSWVVVLTFLQVFNFSCVRADFFLCCINSIVYLVCILVCFGIFLHIWYMRTAAVYVICFVVIVSYFLVRACVFFSLLRGQIAKNV